MIKKAYGLRAKRIIECLIAGWWFEQPELYYEAEHNYHVKGFLYGATKISRNIRTGASIRPKRSKRRADKAAGVC